jgi:hypothetical protein
MKETILTMGATNMWQFDIKIVVLSAILFAGVAVVAAHGSKTLRASSFGPLSPYLLFAYNNFLKPHDAKAGDGQQSALESFYARQVGCGTCLS